MKISAIICILATAIVATAFGIISLPSVAAGGFSCDMINDATVRAACIKERPAKDRNVAGTTTKKSGEAQNMERKRLAREAVKNNLKDPESAQFRNETIIGTSACGEVNAKNSYGGYVGFKRYLFASNGAAAIDGDENNLLFQGWWEANCL